MILITGATGIMGKLLTARLFEAGEAIRVVALPGDQGVRDIAGYIKEVHYGDIASAESIANCCRGVRTVYHCAAVILAADERRFLSINVDGTKNLVTDAIKQGVNHFIYISSASVVYPKPTPYSISKRLAEACVVSSGIAYTIVRPTLVYDHGRGGLEFDLFLEYLRKYPIVPFIGRGGSLKRPVFSGDIIEGLMALGSQRRGSGTIYNFSGDEAITMKQFARLCLKLMGLPHKKIVCIPVWLCRCIAFVMKKTMAKPPLTWQTIAGITQDANLDYGSAHKELGYSPHGVSTYLPRCFPRIGRET
ncbi:MAG: NAD-dependent epimerase/dehydratase family protein [Chitinivibrionales bacterium]|nr:NAD-dependent epimerase/dehydratase family protein [Chitinivibrionales bacterium]